MSNPTPRQARCPHCGTTFDVPELWLSATMICPECFTTIPLTGAPAAGPGSALPAEPTAPPPGSKTAPDAAAGELAADEIGAPAGELAVDEVEALAPEADEQSEAPEAEFPVEADEPDPTEPLLPRGIPLEVGLEGALNGVVYRIMARVGLRDDSEAWDEWLLLAPSGEGHWLSDSQARGLVLWTPAAPPRDFDPANVARGSVLRLAGGHARVRARGSAQVDRLEAEYDLPLGAAPGDRLDYADAIGPHGLHTVQWIGDQVECFHGRALRREDVERAFGLATGPDWRERPYL
jgi:hypothetical protein